MATKRAVAPSAESIARAERKQLAAEDGAKAMAEWDRRATAVRSNMERLRALRLAKEAQDATAGGDAASASSAKRRKKVAR
ncbi:transcriptional regulator [Bradyrhizobium sp. SRS-191]|uniref:transcriptional regulator n=1 Tax=Bradyrhizobium sp. SRS-191 TaxID=2962606 RepID=UPI00211ED79C|nr:transcriptional regulator [Bradyrhizobium sp. SRS-191]